MLPLRISCALVRVQAQFFWYHGPGSLWTLAGSFLREWLTLNEEKRWSWHSRSDQRPRSSSRSLRAPGFAAPSAAPRTALPGQGLRLCLQSHPQQQVPWGSPGNFPSNCDALAARTAVPYNSARCSHVLVLPLEKQNKQHLWLKLCFHCQMLFLQYIFGSHWWMIDTFNLKFHYC